MPGAYYLSIASGFSVSSAMALDRPAPLLCLAVPSLSAAEVRVEYATASGGPDFAPLVRTDGSAVPWSAYSGAGPATALVPIATPWFRLTTAGTNQTGTRSFSLTVTRAWP